MAGCREPGVFEQALTLLDQLQERDAMGPFRQRFLTARCSQFLAGHSLPVRQDRPRDDPMAGRVHVNPVVGEGEFSDP